MYEQFFIGEPVEFHKLCFIYPPTVKDIINNSSLGVYYKLLLSSQEDIEDEFAEQEKDLKDLLTPFEYLLNLSYNNAAIAKIAKEAFFFFIHENVSFLYEQKMIIIGEWQEAKKIEDLKILKEEDFFEFQNILRVAVGQKMESPPDPTMHPKLKAMKAKARLRDRVKAKSKDALTLQTLLSSICCMNLGLNPLNIGELSYAAVNILLRTYQEKEKYETDVKSLLAGADAKKLKIKYWIRNLDD